MVFADRCRYSACKTTISDVERATVDELRWVLHLALVDPTGGEFDRAPNVDRGSTWHSESSLVHGRCDLAPPNTVCTTQKAFIQNHT